MATDMTPVFMSLLNRNRGPVLGDPTKRKTPDYDVVAKLDGSVITLVLGFRSGSVYCCFEFGCHVSLRDGERWLKLRKENELHGIVLPSQLTVQAEVRVEKEAISCLDGLSRYVQAEVYNAYETCSESVSD